MKIIVSPSGKFYGSEQVLSDYLQFTQHSYTVFVAEKGLFYNHLRNNFNQHRIRFFTNVKWLYLRISLLCLTRKVESVYVNEAGHSRYLEKLSRLFPSTRFVVHVRIVEDAAPGRWPKNELPDNLKVVAVSRFISQHLPVTNIQLYDPFPFTLQTAIRRSSHHPLIVGIIGRISTSKGVDTILSLLDLIMRRKLSPSYAFYFFGEVDPNISGSSKYRQLKSFENVKLCGFEANKTNIYNSIDCVLHASPVEPLGRIFFEAIEYGRPFIGVNSAGIGEIGALLNLSNFLIENDHQLAPEQFLEKLTWLNENYDAARITIDERRELASSIFSPAQYAKKIDGLLAN